jgi:apolipoprotein N-acyltransferase
VLKNEAGSIYFRGAYMADVTRDQRWIGRNSFYVEHGEWFVMACAVVAAMGFSLLGMGEAPAAAQPEKPE